MERFKYLAVDFDDTLYLRESWDNLKGSPNYSLISLVKELKKRGWKIILWTCRSCKALKEALIFCEENGIKLDFVNENPEAIAWFEETFGLKFQDFSPKVFADVYIDDSAYNLEIFNDPNKTLEQKVEFIECLVNKRILSKTTKNISLNVKE